MQLTARSYTVRTIEPADRAKWDEWEKEQGFTRERLVCAVCGNPWLSPTSKGTARTHRRDDDPGTPTWDAVRRLRQDIKTLQAELDRVLDLLEP